MSTAAVSASPTRIGVVQYLNTLPLIDGLDKLQGIDLRPQVPSRLIDRLLGGEVDLALCSSIDYQRSPEPLIIVPAGALACRGPTMTVRLYSTRPPEQTTHVHVDSDSHTSVVLLQVLWMEMYGVMPKVVPFDAAGVAHHPAMLLIGDKVVTAAPDSVKYPHQIDLGAAWLEVTGLPFVFALWLARAADVTEGVRTAARVLDRQRRHNRERLDVIVHRHAAARGWPAELARTYLSERLRFDLDEECRRGLDRYFELAHRHGLIPQRRPLNVMEL